MCQLPWSIDYELKINVMLFCSWLYTEVGETAIAAAASAADAVFDLLFS